MNTERALSHAYIIAAPPDAGFARAQTLAQAMLCTGSGTKPCGICRDCRKVSAGIHPDVLVTERQKDDKGKEKREIYVEQVREIVSSAVILPNEAEKKVYIIRDAGTMNAAAQNALLKILEEPPVFDAFILIADNAGQLLETVRSRCVTLYENGGGDALGEDALALAAEYLDAAASGDRLRLLRFANAHGDLSAAEVLEFAQAAKRTIADTLCGRAPDRGMSRKDLLRLTQLMDKTEEYSRFNVGTRHVLGMLTAETIPLRMSA